MKEIAFLYQELHDFLGRGNISGELCQQIRDIIQTSVDAIPAGARVAIRGGGAHTSRLLDAFDFTGKNIVGIFDRKKVAETQRGYPCYGAEELPKMDCGYVVLSSFYYRQELLEEARSYAARTVDIYGALEERGIRLIGQFDQYGPESPLVLNFFYLRYLENRGTPEEGQCVTELLQAAVELKDFVMVYRIFQESGGADGENKTVLEAWARTEKLLRAIRRRVDQRKQRDIMIFWTDAVSYYQLSQLPLTESAAEEGCFFRRAYTPTPFTQQTLCAMFTGMLPIDDYGPAQEPVCAENSSLLRYLEERDYDVKFISHLEDSMDQPHRITASLNASCNVKWWLGLERWLSSEKPCCYIFHLLVESHEPNLSPDLRDVVDTTVSSPRQERQRAASIAYLDRCLALYRALAGDTVQVFLGDHGQYVFPSASWSEERLHTYCFALGKNIPPAQIDRFFPYQRFEHFVRWLVEPEANPLENACADEAVFQDTDFYNPERIGVFIRRNMPREGIAVRGVVDGTGRYALNGLGEEAYYLRGEDGSEEPGELDGARRQALREKCGTKFLDISQKEEFRHARALYEYLRQGAQPRESERPAR